MPRKSRKKLPNKIIVIPNPDKLWHEKWTKNRNPLNVPHPFRCVCLGPPNVGKTLIVKNILLRADPPFEELFIVHCDPDYTKEYDDVGGQFLDEIPHPSELEGAVKTLFVLDDLEYKGMDKVQKSNLNRLYGNASTHKHISVMLCSQDPFNVPVCVRRCSNLWVLWKTPDMDAMATCARKIGMKSSTLSDIFNGPIFTYTTKEGPDGELIETEPYSIDTDSLWIDLSKKSPYPLRKNAYEMLRKVKADPSA